jgi:hypothetical protein
VESMPRHGLYVTTPAHLEVRVGAGLGCRRLQGCWQHAGLSMLVPEEARYCCHTAAHPPPPMYLPCPACHAAVEPAALRGHPHKGVPSHEAALAPQAGPHPLHLFSL